MISKTCNMGIHRHCGGQVKFANAEDNTVDDCFECECECHKCEIHKPEVVIPQGDELRSQAAKQEGGQQ